MLFSEINAENFHFIGIGGAGMTPMAMIVQDMGGKISGSDLEYSTNIKLLQERGVKVFPNGHRAENLPSEPNTAVIASSAIKNDNPEIIEAQKKKFPILKRGEFLAKIAEKYDCPIAVAGSHGKSSITAMTVHCLRELGLSPGFMIGAKVKGWKYSGCAGEGKIFVTESDESDGTNRLISAKIAIVSNVDDDHEWNFSGGRDELFANFAKFALKSEILIHGRGCAEENLFSKHKNRVVVSPNETDAVKNLFPDWAEFQIFNAIIAAKAASEASGIKFETALSALRNFPGLERRMSERFKNENLLLIEDYAHHPSELSALIKSLKKLCENRKIWIVFQPHRYARLKKYFQQFVRELQKADKVFVLPVFSAWTSNDELDSTDLVDKLNKSFHSDFAKFANGNFEKIAEDILSEARGEKILLAVVGAGDCDKLVDEFVRNLRRAF